MAGDGDAVSGREYGARDSGYGGGGYLQVQENHIFSYLVNTIEV